MNYIDNGSPWIIRGKNKKNEKIRIFCFSYAGGGASVFRTWSEFLPEFAGIYPVQLPGRENRISEKPIDNMEELLEILSDELFPFLGSSFVLLGHSLGARIAFGLAGKIERKFGLTPLNLVVSGSRSPEIPEPRPLHHLPDDIFLEELKRFSGTPSVILENRELMKIFIPALRADFTLDETWKFLDAEPVDCPVTAFCGSDDPEADREAMLGWKKYTMKSFTLNTINGGHFFINEKKEDFLKALSIVMEEYGKKSPHSKSVIGQNAVIP